MRTLLALHPPLLLTVYGAVLTHLSWLGAVVALFGAVDTVGRYKDYRYLANFNYLPPRLADYYGQSRCGRAVVLALFPDMRQHYRQQGYRWWHFLPDNFPHFLVERRFWRALVGGHNSARRV